MYAIRSYYDLPVGGANILKQDALSIGADLAVPKGTVTAAKSHVDAVLVITSYSIHYTKLYDSKKFFTHVMVGF